MANPENSTDKPTFTAPARMVPTAQLIAEFINTVPSDSPRDNQAISETVAACFEQWAENRWDSVSFTVQEVLDIYADRLMGVE